MSLILIIIKSVLLGVILLLVSKIIDTLSPWESFLDIFGFVCAAAAGDW